MQFSYHLFILMNCVHVLLVSSIGFKILQRHMIPPFEWNVYNMNLEHIKNIKP
jgi:hypothetical protein